MSFISKKQKLAFDLQRLEQRQQKLELAKLRKQEALENVDLDEEMGDKIKISRKDYDLLQQAKE